MVDSGGKLEQDVVQEGWSFVVKRPSHVALLGEGLTELGENDGEVPFRRDIEELLVFAAVSELKSGRDDQKEWVEYVVSAVFRGNQPGWEKLRAKVMNEPGRGEGLPDKLSRALREDNLGGARYVLSPEKVVLPGNMVFPLLEGMQEAARPLREMVFEAIINEMITDGMGIVGIPAIFKDMLKLRREGSVDEKKLQAMIEKKLAEVDLSVIEKEFRDAEVLLEVFRKIPIVSERESQIWELADKGELWEALYGESDTNTDISQLLRDEYLRAYARLVHQAVKTTKSINLLLEYIGSEGEGIRAVLRGERDELSAEEIERLGILEDDLTRTLNLAPQLAES